MGTLTDLFRFATGQKSEAEEQVDMIYGPARHPDIVEPDTSALTWWDTFKENIVPESHGESLVRAIYGPGGTAQMGLPDPKYNVEDLSSPNVYVQAKGAVVDTVSAVSGFLQNRFLLLAAVAVGVLLIYALAPTIIRSIVAR